MLHDICQEGGILQGWQEPGLGPRTSKRLCITVSHAAFLTVAPMTRRFTEILGPPSQSGPQVFCSSAPPPPSHQPRNIEYCLMSLKHASATCSQHASVCMHICYKNILTFLANEVVS